jgi:hypothetical protein
MENAAINKPRATASSKEPHVSFAGWGWGDRCCSGCDAKMALSLCHWYAEFDLMVLLELSF